MTACARSDIYLDLLTLLRAFCPRQAEEKLPVTEKQYVGAMEACMRQVRIEKRKQANRHGTK